MLTHPTTSDITLVHKMVLLQWDYIRIRCLFFTCAYSISIHESSWHPFEGSGCVCGWVLQNFSMDKCGLTWPKSIHCNPHSGMSGGLVGMWLDSIENSKFCMFSPACYKLVPACYLLALTFRMMLPTFQFLVPASRCADQYF